MKLLAEIHDEVAGQGSERERLGAQYELRKSARAILLNDIGQMAVQYVKNHNYHKLPGGGVEVGESVEQALIREVREEVGCPCAINDLMGVVIEYRNEHRLLHISYGFTARIIGVTNEPSLEAGEIEEGQETVWLLPEDAFAQMRNDEPKEYKGHFIRKREMAFLAEYLQRRNL